jgi:murein L,D-transpeptidase YcbB/YkuD
MGGAPVNADTSAVFDDATEQAVKAFQSSLGLTPDGIVTQALIREMNRPAISRLQQVMVNMERMRWQPLENEGRHILVNIPEFVLHAWEGKTKAFDMPIVVGKQGHGTVLFAGSLGQIVFSPYWNVPESIVRKEILPEMRKNRLYLSENDMEITGERNGLPVVRQLPGDKNELGKLKFLFPNSFNIYFHDTPHKWLFSRDKRAYSHGCIRLQDARKMAGWLLNDMPAWPPERIDSAMNAGKEQAVKPEKPVPVLINYYTAWVDENGIAQFRQDIYRHDQKLAAKLFEEK